jgi:hypothetical protein
VRIGALPDFAWRQLQPRLPEHSQGSNGLDPAAVDRCGARLATSEDRRTNPGPRIGLHERSCRPLVRLGQAIRRLEDDDLHDAAIAALVGPLTHETTIHQGADVDGRRVSGRLKPTPLSGRLAVEFGEDLLGRPHSVAGRRKAGVERDVSNDIGNFLAGRPNRERGPDVVLDLGSAGSYKC